MTPAFDETAVRSDIRARVDIVDLAREHGVDLRRVGDRHVGLCPFHAEKTPSFTISNGLFHCFSCGAGGSAFDFVMRAQGVGFREARTVLADRAGVSLDRARRNHPRRGPREPTARERAALERERVFDELRSDIWAVYRRSTSPSARIRSSATTRCGSSFRRSPSVSYCCLCSSGS